MQEFLLALQTLLQQVDLPAILWVVTLAFASAVWALFLYLRMAKLYNVAMIGLPTAGKTTLIISLYEQIDDCRIKGVEATLATETREKVKAGIALLATKDPLGPTTDQDKYAYRTKIVLGSILKRTYHVDIADFPGGDSKDLGDERATQPLLDPEFAKWVIGAHAFIFLVDVAKCFVYDHGVEINEQHVNEISSHIRTAWLATMNNHTAGRKRLKSYPVVLAFTKSDLVNYVSEASDANVPEAMQRWGFDEIPEIGDVDPQKFSQWAPRIIDAFSEIRSLLEQTSDNYRREVFVSSFGNMDGVRLGLDKLLQAILLNSPL